MLGSNLISSMKALGVEALGRCLGHESRTSPNCVCTLIKETLESSLAATLWKHSRKKKAICKPGSVLSPDTRSTSALILNFPTSRTKKTKVLSFRSHAIYGILLLKPVWTKILGMTMWPSISQWDVGVRNTYNFWVTSFNEKAASPLFSKLWKVSMTVVSQFQICEQKQAPQG